MTYYSTAGYSAIDHQLDPLLDVARQWIHPEWHTLTADESRDEAERIAETLEAAAAYVRALGTPAEPLDVYCDECGAGPAQGCWRTPENATVIVASMTDQNVTDTLEEVYDVATVYDESWPDETPGPVPMDTQRADLIENMSYEDLPTGRFHAARALAVKGCTKAEFIQ